MERTCIPFKDVFNSWGSSTSRIGVGGSIWDPTKRKRQITIINCCNVGYTKHINFNY